MRRIRTDRFDAEAGPRYGVERSAGRPRGTGPEAEAVTVAVHNRFDEAGGPKPIGEPGRLNRHEDVAVVEGTPGGSVLPVRAQEEPTRP